MKTAIEQNCLVPAEISSAFLHYLKRLKEQSQPIYILKDNNIEAVLINIEEYEHLLEISQMYEELQMVDLALKRLEQPQLGQDFEEILAERGLGLGEVLQD